MRSMIKAALDFGTFGNASDQMKSIALRATEALRAIGGQSPINARRIRLYGVTLEEPGRERLRLVLRRVKPAAKACLRLDDQCR
jgi:hypothetical protein